MIFVDSAPDRSGGESGESDSYHQSSWRKPSAWPIAICTLPRFTMRLAKLFTGISVSRAGVFITYISGIPARLFSESPSQNDD
jgi:hypothetical protein